MDNSTVVIYTALFGDYDRLIEPPADKDGCKYICFTDQSNVTSAGWEVVHVKGTESSSVLDNRKYKILPHLFLSEYKYSMYVDSNVKIIKNPCELIKDYLKKSNFCLPKHFERSCLYQEVEECIALGKTNKSEINSLLSHIEASGFPANYGLAENNILIREHNQPDVIELMEAWWNIFVVDEYPKRDQLTLMFLIWKLHKDFTYMKESSRNSNAFFRFKLHKAADRMSFRKKFALYISSTRDQNRVHKIIYNFNSFVSRNLLKKRSSNHLIKK